MGEGDALAVGGGAVNGAILVDGDGNVFGAVGSADDVGRVWFYVEAHEHGVVDVAVLLELNDSCALEDAVDPHGRVEKNGGLHVSPSPSQALARSQLDEWKGVRFFEVTCPVSELVSVADDVCKAPRLRVVREVDSWGEPL